MRLSLSKIGQTEFLVVWRIENNIQRQFVWLDFEIEVIDHPSEHFIQIQYNSHLSLVTQRKTHGDDNDSV